VHIDISELWFDPPDDHNGMTTRLVSRDIMRYRQPVTTILDRR
jgi:hypothetical protein